MGRRKTSIQNTIIALISEIMVTVVGFLLPKAIIINYGSSANGLITSLQQFMQYFTLLEAGLSGAAVFALYKPLSVDDNKTVERILYSAKKMYFKIGIIFVTCVIISSIIYPHFIADTGYSNSVVSALFCMIGLNGATQLLFIGKYKVLLNASQNNRYIAMINAGSTCLYSIIIIVASYCKLSLVVAVGLGVTAYCIRAMLFYFVTKHLFPKYQYKTEQEIYIFKNQKEVFIQQILSLLILNSSVLILSFTKTSMSEISVYTVYNMVLTAVFMITNAVNTGVSASFGDLIARKDIIRLKKIYAEYEVLFQAFWTLIFTCVSVLYRPFMHLYTGNIKDQLYVRPSLCILFSILGALWVIRNQQSVIIVAAGKFKEIQMGSVVEAIMTIVLSILGLSFFGLEGLLIGRIISAFYRVIDFVIFSSKNVLENEAMYTFKKIFKSTVVVVFINVIIDMFSEFVVIDSYITWIVEAIVVSILSILGYYLIDKEFRMVVCNFVKKKNSIR